MARRGRGGGKRGPDLAWDDEEDDPSTFNTPNRPAPQFPDIQLPVPRPISAVERACVQNYLRLRDRAHNGPYYSVLDASSLADAKTGKVIKRAGFDPFNDQEKYTAKYYKKKRTVPDLSGRNHELRYFPTELWPLLDPRHTHSLWKSTDIDIDAETNAPRKKRKRDVVIEEEENEDEAEKANDSDDGSDPLLSGTRRSRNSTKRRRDNLTTRKAGEKRGLDAEDDFSEEEIQPRPRRNKKDKAKGSDDEDDDDDDENNNDNNDNDNSSNSDDDDDDDGSADDEPVDSEFEESDDDANDYDAEKYFDTGEGDDDDGLGGGGGGDDDGGVY
ncbi:hypothetical protein A1O3_08086 [Capronia epimyces CBS 606.96]|uniref:DNA-directed RNA polymerase III subunit n=1 Tax=Capronia epimyces CBS 606.96 TaxID=1182542 RepID=W9XS34_9EURO|nr:uncharacterized protein A1O3_08086 [Capronia epimyces CBS 606.96]EXJ79801.1 hypothetical protein A1O3_08086 [Capronia epimyces CBS 606.96]